MSLESFLSKKLQKFTIVDIALVKLVYLMVSFLVFSLYAPLASIGWGAYLLFMIFAAFPLITHEFSVKGPLSKKLKNYLKTNNPSNQILLFFTVFFTGCFLCVLIPVIASLAWWYYVIAIVVLAIKPAMHNLYW